MIISLVSMAGNVIRDSEQVAIDHVGAGIGDLVLIARGSSARDVFVGENRGIDCAVVGIIDSISNS